MGITSSTTLRFAPAGERLKPGMLVVPDAKGFMRPHSEPGGKPIGGRVFVATQEITGLSQSAFEEGEQVPVVLVRGLALLKVFVQGGNVLGRNGPLVSGGDGSLVPAHHVDNPLEYIVYCRETVTLSVDSLVLAEAHPRQDEAHNFETGIPSRLRYSV